MSEKNRIGDKVFIECTVVDWHPTGMYARVKHLDGKGAKVFAPCYAAHWRVPDDEQLIVGDRVTVADRFLCIITEIRKDADENIVDYYVSYENGNPFGSVKRDRMRLTTMRDYYNVGRAAQDAEASIQRWHKEKKRLIGAIESTIAVIKDIDGDDDDAPPETQDKQ